MGAPLPVSTRSRALSDGDAALIRKHVPSDNALTLAHHNAQAETHPIRLA